MSDLNKINLSNIEDTPIIEYTPSDIDEYEVVVLLPEYWEEIHNYIINENEIDGIPNRRITCLNEKCSSLRTAVYEMSVAEADVLREHEKIEAVELNPDKYPQPSSTRPERFTKKVAFNKYLAADANRSQGDLVQEWKYHAIQDENGLRSNWAMKFMSDPENFFAPYTPGPVGVGSTTVATSDLEYSYNGKGVDAITVDSGCGVLHPEFIDDDGSYRMRDVILDGPYYLDPDFFDTNNFTYTKVLDGNTIGVGIATDKAREWWTDSTKRSAKFSSLDTITSIDSRYTYGHAVATAEHTNDPNPIVDSHGTSCASQIGGKTFGLAFKANLWSIRIALDGTGFVGGTTATTITRIFHQAKKINDPINHNPTITNNSWGSGASAVNINNVTKTIGYRGTTTSYTGNGDAFTPPANSKGIYNTTVFAFFNPHTPARQLINSGAGGFTFQGSSQDNTNAAAEDAIAAGVILATAAGNTNHKFTDKNDPDHDNWYETNTNKVGLCRGIEQGFSGDYDVGKGVIRVGNLANHSTANFQGTGQDRQGNDAYKPIKANSSVNGPMIDIFAPGQGTMAASYKPSYDNQDFQRNDNSSFFDAYFGGTSSACPHTVSLLCLYLESNRKANQSDARKWLTTEGCKEGLMQDPFPDINSNLYWSQAFNGPTDFPDDPWDTYITRGNGNLRGAPNRVVFNPFANASPPTFKGVKFSGISFKQT